MKMRVLTLVAAGALALSGCAGTPTTGQSTVATTASATAAGSADEGIQVAAAFYPLEYAAQLAGGEKVTITNLTVPGQEPHDLELTPQQIASLDDADLVVYLGGFQPAVDEAVAQSKAAHKLDLAEHIQLHEVTEHVHDHAEDHDHEAEATAEATDEHDHGNTDPHFWLDPTLMAKAVDEIAAHLGQIDATHADTYTANAQAASASLTALDEEYTTGLASCSITTIITSHAAFGYLADRYHLEQIGISGISPNEQPSPARMAEVQEEAQAHGVSTIFFETLTSPDVATTIANELGLTTAVLDPIEGITADSPGDDYTAVMKANLAALQKANDCS